MLRFVVDVVSLWFNLLRRHLTVCCTIIQNVGIDPASISMWREFIQKLMPECDCAPPAANAQIVLVEEALEVRLPDELRELLQECNGVISETGVNIAWPTDRIEADNIEFRTNADFRRLYMPFKPLLFFADDGSGNQFAFPIHDGVIRRGDIFVWDREDDSRSWAAPSLKSFFEWWNEGRIKY
jgi:hypothetical protein